MLSIAKSQKNRKNYECKICDYTTCNKYDFDKHTKTIKHINSSLAMSNANLAIDLSQKSQEKCFECQNCGKKYKDNSGLWRHKTNSNCIKTIENNETENNEAENNEIENNEFIKNTDNKDDLINYLIKENQEFKNLILEIVKKDTYTTNNNTTNSHNKAFNLNFFLNETCKNAMNITDFVESIQFQLSDLEKMGEIGYVEGISNIIVKNLNALDVTQRPLHCTDKKRETIYIKDEDKWEKDDEKNKIRKVIKNVALKNARLIQKFKEKHPDYNEYHSKYSTQYHKLIIESFGGSGDNDLEKEDKIIRNISKNVVLNKE